MPFDGTNLVAREAQPPQFPELLDEERRLSAQNKNTALNADLIYLLVWARGKEGRSRILAQWRDIERLCTIFGSFERHLSKPVSSRASEAAESLMVLDFLEKLFDGGANWWRGRLHDGWGRHCLVGALEIIRSVRGRGDNADGYLNRAISIAYVYKETLVSFNDGSQSYAEVRAMILLARQLAEDVVDRHNRRGNSFPKVAAG
jgi:hypothetical protein